MKKAVFIFCLAVLFCSPKLIYAHGFGVHAAHLSSILALNDQYKTLIENPKYQPYFIYGSIFPDIQYATGFKSTLQNLYQKIRATTLKEATKGWIPDNAAAFDGLTYEINTDQIPDVYPFGIDTHNDKYALAFAEYLLQQCTAIDPPGPNPGSNGTTTAHDARNMKLAFALGYYAHLTQDVACHDFMIPRVTASLDLGDLELIKNSQSFSEDPNAQLEGIIEGIMDHYYGSNSTIADMIYNEIWVGRSQFEPTITQMDFTKGYAHLFFNGPTPTYYDANGGFPEMNPVLLFFHSALNTWYNTNPFNLPTGVDGYKKSNSPLSATGFYQLASVFRFVNRFYPAIAGQPFNGFNRLDEVLADWVSNHLDLSDATNAYGIALSYFTLGFPAVILAQEINVSMLSGLVYLKIVDQFSSDLSSDARSLVGLMLSDMAKADELVTKYPDRINMGSYNKLKSSLLFTNPTGLLSPLWTEYKSLGTKIYQEVGPSGKWYTDWSPWHKQSMAWGVLSSLNNSLPDIYTSNQNVAVYDAYFEVNTRRIIGSEPSGTFNNNPVVKTKIELYNTSNVPSESITLKVKRDHNSTDYSLDPLKTSTTFSIDQDPLLYNTTDRKKVELIVPSVSLSELTDYRGYYMEAVNNSNNKAMFTSSFEQYQQRLDLTPNYAKLYGSYDQGKWPISLGLVRSVATVNLNTAQFPEGGGPGGYYKINGVAQNSIIGCVDDYINLEAIPPTGWFFYGWSDGNIENPRNYRISSTTVNLSANYKGQLLSNSSTGFSSNSQRKFVRVNATALYAVYESLNTCWLEFSSDNGTTWMILNNGHPITTTGSSPSLAVVKGFLLVTYLSNNDVKLAIVNTTTNILNSNITVTTDPGLATPVVEASGSAGDFLVVWKSVANSCLSFRRGYWMDDEFGITILHFYENVSSVVGTDQYSCNPALTLYSGSANKRKYKLAYEQQNYGNISSNIYYTSFSTSNNVTVNSLVTSISSASGYTWNYNPSIIDFNGVAKVVWIGKRAVPPPQNLAKIDGENGTALVTTYDYRTFFRDTSYYRYWSFGSKVNSPTINKTNNAYVFSWSETNDPITNKFADNTLSTIHNLNTTGKDLQLGSGDDKYAMYGMSFSSTALPYNFTRSNSIGSVALAKENYMSINEGREGAVVKNNCQLYFTLGDVMVNEEKISFKTIPDTFSVTSVNDINNYVKTNPFNVTDNSLFLYSVQYGITDAERLKNTFVENDVVSFRVELVDAATESVLGVFDDVSFTKQNAVPYDNFSYEVSTEGIGNRTVYLRLITNAPDSCMFSLTNKLDNQSIIAKRYVKQVAYKSVEIIKDYALAQNYPNPFNPVTTINYQLPKEGIVTLKIYDILGNEVKMLVNEQREKGRYTVQFDASTLASGMYVYQIKANDYVATKKMMMLK